MKKISLVIVPCIFIVTSCELSLSSPQQSAHPSGGSSFDTNDDESGGDGASSFATGGTSSDTSASSGGSMSTNTGGRTSAGGSMASGGASATQGRTCPASSPVLCTDSDSFHCCYANEPYCGEGLCAVGPAIGPGVEDSRCTQGTQKGVWCSNDGGYCCPDYGPICTSNKGCSDTMDLKKGISSVPTGSGGTSSSGGSSFGGGGGADTCNTAAVQAKMNACAALINVNDAISPSCAGACANKVEFEACGATECGQWKANCDAAALMAKATGSSNKCASYCPAACT